MINRFQLESLSSLKKDSLFFIGGLRGNIAVHAKAALDYKEERKPKYHFSRGNKKTWRMRWNNFSSSEPKMESNKKYFLLPKLLKSCNSQVIRHSRAFWKMNIGRAIPYPVLFQSALHGRLFNRSRKHVKSGNIFYWNLYL